MADTVEKIIERLQDEGEKTVSFFRALPEDAWSLQVYTDGEQWQVRDLFIHLVQAEHAIARLVETILEGHAGVPENFDLNEYNHRKVHEMENLPLDYLVPLFSERRAKTIAMVRKMDDFDLDLQGRHPFLGIAPISEILKLMYRHTQLHQRDIRKLLKDE